MTLVHYIDLLRFDSPARQAIVTTVGLALLISSLNVVVGLFFERWEFNKTFSQVAATVMSYLGRIATRNSKRRLSIELNDALFTGASVHQILTAP